MTKEYKDLLLLQENFIPFSDNDSSSEDKVNVPPLANVNDDTQLLKDPGKRRKMQSRLEIPLPNELDINILSNSNIDLSPPSHYNQSISSKVAPNDNIINKSRTLYLSAVKEDELTAADILSAVRGGPVEAFRFHQTKDCAFLNFVDERGATIFYNRLGPRHSLLLKEREIRVRWATHSTPLSESIRIAIRHGATRNVFVGGLAERGQQPSPIMIQHWERCLRQVCSLHGNIVNLTIRADKRCAFVNMTSISEAMRVVNELTSRARAGEQPWRGLSINYGRDPCDVASFSSRGTEAEEGQILAPMLKSITNDTTTAITAAATTITTTNTTDVTMMEEAIPQRTIYLGGIPTDTTAEQICNVIRGGGLEKLRILLNRRSAFVTFIEEEAAQAFLNFVNRYPGLISIGGISIKVASSPPSALPHSTRRALSFGATRVIYLSNIELTGMQVEDLRTAFEVYGQIERVTLIRRPRDSAFISFYSIEEAVKAMIGIKRNPLFRNCQIEYGRDRCAEPLVEPLPFQTFVLPIPCIEDNYSSIIK